MAPINDARFHSRERGSALLIVFVFAAIIAISLFAEMPVTLFEAKRQKEQLLVDRGHEYVRAVQLYYRRNRGQYPASIEQLENTNNIRYLRKQYVDPFTGKADWRLLHAGPGGMLTDSKVKRSVPGTTGASGQSGSAPASSTTPHDFGTDSDSDSAAVTVPAVPQRPPAVPQRPPAVPAGGGPSANQSSGVASSAQLDQNPDTPILPPADDGTGLDGNAAAPQRTARAQDQGQQASQQSNVMQSMSPLLNNPTPAGQTVGTTPGSFGSTTGGTTTGGMGQMNGGGALAGVASKAKGKTIKEVGEQTDYSLWEFYYDPSKDTGLSGGTNQIAPVQNSNGTGTNLATSGTQSGTQAGQATPTTSTSDQPASQPVPPTLQAQPQQ